MDLTTLLAQLVSNIRANLWKVVMKSKYAYIVLTFGPLFSECAFLKLSYFFSSLVLIQSLQFFSGTADQADLCF